MRIPAGATVLDVQMQGSSLVMWCLVDPEAPLEPRTFEVFGTGWLITPIDGKRRVYLGTVITGGPKFVFHVFEIVPY